MKKEKRKERPIEKKEIGIQKQRFQLMKVIATVTDNPRDFFLAYVKAAALLLHPITYEGLMSIPQFKENINKQFQRKS